MDRHPRARSSTSTGCGGRRRCTGPAAWSRRCRRPAHIYFKYEGTSLAGSHKPNTAIAQAYYNKEAGIRRLVHRDGRGAMGLGPVVRLPVLRPRVPRVHGEGVVRAEAVPADLHGDVRARRCTRRRATETQAGQRILAEHPGLDRLPRHRDHRGRRGRRDERRHQLLAGQRARPRAAAPDGRSVSRRRSRWRWRASRPTSSSAASAADRTTPGSPTRSWATSSTASWTRGSSPPSRPPARR